MKHFSMKRNIFSKCLYGMMALGLLASCSNEPLLEDTNDKVLENETTTYVRISLVGEGIGSRTVDPDGYENGTPDESAVGSLTLTFFDKERKYVATQHVDMTNAYVTDGNGNTVDKIVTVVTPVNITEGSNEPAWVVAYVNPTSAAADLEFDKLEKLMTKTRLRNQVSHQNGYRTMNNSVYYDVIPGTDQTVVRYATPVVFEDQFYLTENDAKAEGAQSIEITVERVEAKVKVTMPETNNISNVAANDNSYTMQFVPQGWFVNATEKRTFLIKNYRKVRANYTDNVPLTENLTDYFMDYNYLSGDEAFKSTDFNNSTYKRSFWAIDPTYFTDTKDIYPDVSYDVKYNGINTDGNEYTLLYRSFEDALKDYDNGSTNYMKFNNNKKTHEYVLENTMSKLTLQSADAMASMTSVELIGYYIVKKGNDIVFDGSQIGEEKTYDGKSFYIRHEGSATSPSYKCMLGDNEAIDYFLAHAGNMLYVQQRYTDGTPTGDFITLRSAQLNTNNNAGASYGVDYDAFELVYPKATITGGNKLSEQWRTLSLKKGENGYNENIYIYDVNMNNNLGGYKQVKDLSSTELENLFKDIYNKFGVVERFYEGKAHFTVPLKHIWHPNKNNGNEFNSTTVGLGHYGVVRNHIYDLTIGTIKGLGSGIGDPEQPIVPPTDNQQYYISTKLNILKWRNVSQSVDL